MRNKKNFFDRFRRERKGATAIEFAIIALPFFGLIFGVLEVAIVALLQSNVANAVDVASRSILTGNASCTTAEEFKEEVCALVTVAGSDQCEQNLKIVVEELNSFASAPSALPAFDNITESYAPGSGGSVMMLRAFYGWDVMVPMLDNALGGADGRVILTNSAAFRNEPYETAAPCP